MSRYRKRPVVVDAQQYLAAAHPPRGVTILPNGEAVCVTIHGQTMQVVFSDWVIAEPDGIHYYPCKAAIFDATYERVNV